MQKLNFPKYNFRFKSNENKTLIFDIIRKKFVILTPEEWVRQHTLHFLITEKKYPVSYINVEKQLLLNDTVKRYDIVIFKNDGEDVYTVSKFRITVLAPVKQAKINADIHIR